MNVYLEKYLEQKYLLEKVEKIIQPMHKIGLRHFAYNEFYVDGTYKILCTNIGWMEYYFDNISILENNLLFNNMVFDSYNRARIIWKLDQKNKITKEMEKYNIYDGYSVYIRMSDIRKIISFHFGTIGQSSDIYKYYLNHDEKFGKFFNYFFAEMSSNALSALTSFYSDDIKILVQKYLNIKYDAFDLSVKRYEIDYNGIRQKISQKEYSCLALLSQGKTAKDIAEHLEISHRTVETHLLNIKYKYNLNTKTQLIELFKKIP